MVATFIQVFCALITLSALSRVTEGGSACPPREDIYPCLCINVPLGKKQMFTTISCRHIAHVDTFANMFSTLKSLHIDRFIIYNSFWEDTDHKNKRLPPHWFSLLKIKELEIIDSDISHDIACGDMIGCPNDIPVSLSIVNSSATDNFVTFCDKGKISFSWINCLSKLKTFNFYGNKLKIIESTFFERPMNELLTVNFSRNEIREIARGAFRNLPKLNMLDLSHNMISNIQVNIFGDTTKELPITHLDVSFNFLHKLSSDIFKSSPFLKYFSAASNRIEKLPKDDWKHLSQDLRTLDLSGNQLNCDCHIIWINCTLKVHVNVLGFCVNEEYVDTPLRRVSKYMSERCENGEIQERVNGTKKNACENWEKVAMAPINLKVTPAPRQQGLRNSRRSRI